MATKIITKNSSTASAVPLAADLVQGELAVNVTDTGLYTENASGTVVKLNAPSIDDKNTGATKYVTIASGGNVGIGTSSPVSKVHAYGAGQLLTLESNADLSTSAGSSFLRFKGTNGNSGYIGFGGTANTLYVSNALSGPMIFETIGAERMRIDSSGNLLVGTTSNQANGKIQSSFDGSSVLGMNIIDTSATATATAISFIKNAGTRGSITVTASATAYVTSSDYRLKENITPMTGALATVAQLKPCNYTWKVDGSAGQGFIAHELQAVVPDAVTGEKDAVDEDGTPKYQGIDTSFLVATLTAAIQELKAELDAAKADIATLKGQA